MPGDRFQLQERPDKKPASFCCPGAFNEKPQQTLLKVFTVMDWKDTGTTAIITALYFGGHQHKAIGFVGMSKLKPAIVCTSRFSRRLHRLQPLIFNMFYQIGQWLKDMAGASEYVIDSFPVAVCDNIRIIKSRLLKGKQWRGKQCSMRRYFYCVKVQVLTTISGIPMDANLKKNAQWLTTLYEGP